MAVREQDRLHPYFTQSGSDREDTPDQYIANMANGAWCGFKYFLFSGQRRISATARGNGQGALLVSTERDGPVLSEISIAPSEAWKEFRGKLPELHGKLPLFFRYQGTGTMDLFEICME